MPIELMSEQNQASSSSIALRHDKGLFIGFWNILKRDLLLTFRRRSDLANPLFFLLMVVSMFPLAVSPDQTLLRDLAPGIVWVAALLSTLLAVDRLFQRDFEDGSLEQLLISPSPLYLTVMGKICAHWIVTGLPMALLAPVIGAMLFLSPEGMLAMLASLLLGTPSLSMISAIGASLTVGIRGGGLLVALIALPLYIPVLIFGAGAVAAANDGLPYGGQLGLLGALLVLAFTLSPLAIAASLRISVDD